MSQLKLIVFLLAIWLPKGNFGALTRTQPHSHDITVLFVVCFEGHLEPCNMVGSKSPTYVGSKNPNRGNFNQEQVQCNSPQIQYNCLTSTLHILALSIEERFG